MNQYLHLRCGALEFLLDIESVEEVAVADDRHDSNGLRLWRQQQIRVSNMNVFFCQEGPCPHQVVVRHETSFLILDVAAIVGLISAEPQQFRAFDAVSERGRSCFDQALPQNDGTCLLRLRLPLTWLPAAEL